MNKICTRPTFIQNFIRIKELEVSYLEKYCYKSALKSMQSPIIYVHVILSSIAG